MSAALAVALADVRERTRRPGFLGVVALAALLGYAVATELVVLRLGVYRGVYDAGWIGVLVAVALGTFLSLVGFYVVRGGVQRDAATGVGQVLAATPLRATTYLVGGFLGNLAILVVAIATLAVAAVAMVVVHGGGVGIDVGAVVVPLLVLTLPVAAVTASAALLFDCVPGLRQGAGNVVYFVLWSVLMGTVGSELIGFAVVEAGAAGALAAAGLPYAGGIALGTADLELTPFEWPGLAWGAVALQRVPFLALAAALVLLARLPFDRFDPGPGRAARTGLGRMRRSVRPPPVGGDATTKRVGAAGGATARPASGWHAATRGTASSALVGLVRAELALLLLGRPWPWYLGAAILVVASALAPAETVRRALLPLAFAWPLLVWSELGARETVHRVRALVVSTPTPVARAALASWLAGMTLALVVAAGAPWRLGQDADAWLGLAAGAAFFPALALALGTLTGSSRPFQVVALVIMYLGALNGVAAFDVTAAAGSSGAPVAYLLLTPLLIAVTVGWRRATDGA